MKNYLICLFVFSLCIPLLSIYGYCQFTENEVENHRINSEIDDDSKVINEVNNEKKLVPLSNGTIDKKMPGRTRSLQVPFFEPTAITDNKIKKKHSSEVLIEIDGFLDDALWKKANLSGYFWCSLEDRAPTEQTEVLVFQDNNYLYFGFKLYDSKPDEIQATKTVRDTGLGYDDSISIEMDTFFNRRDITVFSLNPLGTQTDKIAGGRSSKVEWKGDWLGGAVQTEYGWSAEFAIPFAILNYNHENTVFGINFKRYQSRTKEYSWWADVTPKNLPEEMGTLQGLKLPSAEKSEKKAWTLMPFLLAGKNIPDKDGDIKDTLWTGGVDIRYQPRSDLTGVVSLNPDFSQVEKAATDISFSYSEKAVEDNRPFFAEGLDYFAGNEYFYSNRFADFDYGGKGFGRIGKTNFGILATSAPGDRYDGAGRATYEFNDTHSGAIAITSTKQNIYDNLLALAQFDGRQTSGLEYSLDVAMTDTSNVDADEIIKGQGNHIKGTLGWKSEYWYLKTYADTYDAEYFPALALLDDDVRGTWSTSITTGYYREQSDYFWRAVDTYAGFKYREKDDGLLQTRKWFGGAGVEFQNEIRTSFYAEEGPYRKGTDIPGEFEDTVNQDRYYSTAVDFNTRSSIFSFGCQYDWGRLGGGDYDYWAAYSWWRPVNPVYLNLSYEQTDSFGTSEQLVVVGSWEITPENSLGARYIYYDDEDGDEEYFRIAYGRKARKGFDIFVVYNKEPFLDEQYSIKFVMTF